MDLIKTLLVFLFTLTFLFYFCQSFNLESRLPVIKKGTDGTYFGYSVAEHQVLNETDEKVVDNWLLVGAPLGTNLQPGTNRSGALWKCPLSTYHDDCVQVITDGKKTIEGNDLLPPMKDEIKDGQWLGVTVRSQGPGRKVMVCAHRYISKGEDYQWGRGLCYTLTQRLDYDDSWDPCRGKTVERAHEQYGYCQAGTSGMLLEDDTALIGTPGPYTWRGTVFVFSVSDDFLNRDKSYYYGPLTEPDVPVDKYSYLGMSVTAGYFLKEGKMYYAAGAPRANGTGQVVLYTKLPKPIATLMEVSLILNGEQFASSFGYEVATADINGDGKPDLLVGAPFYFNKDAGGAVYVYINKNYCLDCSPPVKLTGKFETRFGFAISSLGDLNKDKYDDIAIGAPYEEGGRVYIYLGSKDGLILEPSQVIKAEAFDGIATLGYSLSGGIDLDENGYPDLLIGAYSSDSVVLLRSRPIVGLVTQILPEENLKNIDSTVNGCPRDQASEFTCFTFNACVTLEAVVKDFQRNSGVGGQALLYKLVADNKRKFSRVWFGPDNEARPSVMEKEIYLRSDPLTGELKYCHEHTVYIKENTKDIQSPIAFKLSYSLIQREPRQPAIGDPLPKVDEFPILNQQEADKVFSATFHKDCGSNDICESQLHIEAVLMLPTTGANKSSWELMLGQHTEVVLNATAYNFQESAYEAQLFVSHSASLSYIGPLKTKGKQLNCNPFNNTLVVCSLGNPFNRGIDANILLRFDPKELNDAESHLEFSIFANSTSHETDPEEPLRLKATVVKRAELSIKGLARPEQVFYGGQVKGESAMVYKDEIGSRILHTYQVFNQGPWKVNNLQIHVDWPFQVANNKPLGKWLLYMEEKPYIEALGGGKCTPSPGQVNPLGLVNRPGLLETPLEHLTRVPVPVPHNETWSESRIRRRRDTEMIVRAETVIDKDGRKHQLVHMDCLHGTAKCFKFTCIVNSLDKNQEATIFIRARLWNATLVSDYPKVDLVTIASRAKIHIPDSVIIHQDTSDDVAQVETVCKVDLLEQQIAEPIPLWVIIVAIVVGLLVLILLTLLLWKLGFFKRRRPDPTLSGNLEKHRVDDLNDY